MVPATDYQIIVEKTTFNEMGLLGLLAIILVIYNVIMYTGMSVKKRKLEKLYEKIKADKQKADNHLFWNHE